MSISKDWEDIGTYPEYLGMAWEPALPYAILLQDVQGYKESKSMFGYGPNFNTKYVLRGTLLIRLSHEEVKELKQQSDGVPPFNFKVLKELGVKLCCNVNNVLLLNFKQKELLVAINGSDDRLEAVDKLEWAEKLAEDSTVYVTIPTLHDCAKGIVRHIGKLPGETGTKFGVELLEHKYKGTSNGMFKDDQYFECEKDCAVFVALDKLSEHRVPVVSKPPVSATPGSSGGGGSKNAKNLQKQKPVEQQQKQQVYYKTGDKVMAFDDNGRTVHGTVKWTGGSTGLGKLVGIETDVPVNSRKFGGFVTGMHHMFTPSAKKGKEYQLFLPFTCILHKRENPDQNVGDLEASLTTKVALKYAGDGKQVPDNIREQQAAAIEKNKKEADKRKAKNELKLDERDIDDTMTAKTQQEIFDKIKQQQRGSNQPYQGNSTHSPSENQRIHQGDGEAGAQQNFNRVNQRLYQGHSEANAQHDFSHGGDHHQSGSNYERNVQSCLQQPILRAGEMKPFHSQVEPSYHQTDPPHPQNQQLIQPAGGDNMFLGNEGQFQQPNQYYPHASNPQHPPMGGGFPQFSGNVQQMQPGHRVHHPGAQHYDQYEHHHQIAPYQDNSGVGLYPPCSSTSHQASYPNHLDNYHTQQPINVPPQGFPINPYNLEVRSIVQYGDNPNFTGVIKQIHGEMAGVEMDVWFPNGTDGIYDGIQLFNTTPGRGLYVPLKHLRPPQEYIQQAIKKPNPFKLPHNLYEPSTTAAAHFVQAPRELDAALHTGVKGIQGQQNSCYLDATLYGMFAFSDAFDALFLEKNCADSFEMKVKNTLEQKIVNPLRKVHAVVQDTILRLREDLSTLQKMKGITSDEKDPEEFLNLLFKHVLHVDPFLHIKRPSGSDKEFFIQLFVGPDENIPMPDTHWLLHKMFKEDKITFEEYPQKLLLQIPRHGKQFKAFERVKPTLKLDVSVLCEGYAGPCFVCDQPGEELCTECSKLDELKDDITPYFCGRCSVLWHSHPNRQSHKPVLRRGSVADTYPLELLSVLCIETSHYVCFTRITGSGRDQWVFFDSMATRTDDEYNLPRVIDCTEEINEWVYSGTDISKTPSKELPELVRRYVGDPYLCIYTEFGGNLY